MRALLKSFRRARELRGSMTLPEVKLWEGLSRGRLEGFRFRKQHPVGPYILDFYCSRARLAVEVDGEGHGFGDRPDYDARRDQWLRREGIETLRLRAKDVLDDVEGALGLILVAVRARTSSSTA